MIDTPPMRPALRQFVDWVASYTLPPPGEVMAMALRVITPGISPPPTGWQPRRTLARRAHHRGPPEGPGRPGRRANPAPPPTWPAPPASAPA